MRKKHQTINTASPGFKARADRRRQTWTLTVHTSFDDIKDAEYRYWATQPTHAAMAAVAELTAEAYALRGIRVSRLHRSPRDTQ